MDEETRTNNQQNNSVGMFIALIWVILGILGFITSVVCFAYNGTFMQNWVGFLTAVTLGPFYWIYYAMVGDRYCTSQVGGKRQQMAAMPRGRAVGKPKRRGGAGRR